MVRLVVVVYLNMLTVLRMVRLVVVVIEHVPVLRKKSVVLCICGWT